MRIARTANDIGIYGFKFGYTITKSNDFRRTYESTTNFKKQNNYFATYYETEKRILSLDAAARIEAGHRPQVRVIVKTAVHISLPGHFFFGWGGEAVSRRNQIFGRLMFQKKKNY